jgi:hypothetical protein
MKKMILYSLFSSFMFLSCDKYEGTPNTCMSNMSSIAGSYKTKAIQYKASSTATEQDLFAILNVCEKDDIIKLHANGTAEYLDAGTTCNPNTSFTSNWSVNGNSITMDGTAGTIQLFDCKKLVVVTSGAIVSGDQLAVTYEKQ